MFKKPLILGLILAFALFLWGAGFYYQGNFVSKPEVRGGAAYNLSPFFPELVLLKEEAGFSQIYLFQNEGKILRELTSSKEEEILPTFSPGGESLAYFSKINGFWVLRLHNLKTKTGETITVTKGTPLKFSFSPDGKRMWYLEKVKGERRNLYLIELESRQVTLVEREVAQAIWDSKGRRLVYTATLDNEISIYLKELDFQGNLSEARLLISSAKNPLFVFGEEKLIFNDLTLSQDNFSLLDLREGNKELQTTFPWRERKLLSSLALISGQDKIIFARPLNWEKGLGEIWLYDLKTKKATRLFTDGFFPLWWAKEKGIVYVRKDSLKENFQIWFSNLSGLEKKPLVEEMVINAPNLKEATLSPEIFSSFSSLTLDLKLKEKFALFPAEILIDFISGDVNNDGAEENLIITFSSEDQKIHLYIKDQEGQILYTNESFLEYPQALELKNFGDDNFPSYFLIFDLENRSGFYLRWTNEEYMLTK